MGHLKNSYVTNHQRGHLPVIKHGWEIPVHNGGFFRWETHLEMPDFPAHHYDLPEGNPYSSGYPLAHVYIAMENHLFLMGNLTINGHVQ